MKTGLRKSAYMMIAVLTLLLMAYTAVTGDEILMDAAPSADAWRGANGKAMLNASYEYWAAGWDEGWLLVMYETNKGSVRIGYVQPTFNTGISNALTFSKMETTVAQDCTLTDDPAKQYASIMTLQPGDTVTLLTCFYNADAWAYVETTLNGQTVRGFVPMDCLEIDEDASPEIEAVG
jgi:hypothetical protein